MGHYIDELTEKDLQKSILASMKRAEGKKANVSFEVEIDDELRKGLAEILKAIVELRVAISLLPAPVVNVPAPVVNLPAPVVNVPAQPVPEVYVEPPDFTAVVNAVTGLKPGADAGDIANALADVLAPQRKIDEEAVAPLREVAEALKLLDFRLKGVGTQAYGGGAVSFSKAGLEQLTSAFAASSGSSTLLPLGADYVSNTYTGDDLTEVVYKTGGSGGTTIATVTMTYDAGKLETVTVT